MFRYNQYKEQSTQKCGKCNNKYFLYTSRCRVHKIQDGICIDCGTEESIDSNCYHTPKKNCWKKLFCL